MDRRQFTAGLLLAAAPMALTRTAVVLLIVMLVFGVAVYIMGVNSYAPGLGGNINYLIAMLVDFYFLLPSAVAVAVHWRVLNSTASGAAVKPQG